MNTFNNPSLRTLNEQKRTAVLQRSSDETKLFLWTPVDSGGTNSRGGRRLRRPVGRRDRNGRGTSTGLKEGEPYGNKR